MRLSGFRHLAALGVVTASVLAPTALPAATSCGVGERVTTKPDDHTGSVIAVNGSSCQVHFDDPYNPEEWVQASAIDEIVVTIDAHAVSAPTLGRYEITVGRGYGNGYLVLESPSAYELFLPGGKSAGKGTYAFDGSGPRVRWTSGPLANPGWDGTQAVEVTAPNTKIRIGARAVATMITP